MSLNDLLKRPATTPISTMHLLSILRDERRPVQVTPRVNGQQGTPLVLEFDALTQRIVQHLLQKEGDADPTGSASQTNSFTEKEFQVQFSSVEGWEVQ